MSVGLQLPLYPEPFLFVSLHELKCLDGECELCEQECELSL